MIRINLLAVERKAKRAAATPINTGHKLTVACSLILIVAAVFVGWRYWALLQESNRLDEEVAAAQQETTRLHAIIQNVQKFEQQKTQLQQRVVLIEQLRKSQTGPVHMLDQISRAMPPMVWLTDLKQVEDTVTIEGRCTAVTGLTDFVSNLEASGYFKKSIDIVSSQTEQQTTPPSELIKFSIKAQFQRPAEAPVAKRVDKGSAN
jgi:type IV pilus assembly protein PilN